MLDLHTDHLGSVRIVTDDDGGIASRHAYLPFGEDLHTLADVNTHRFTGHERDAETGLDYMLARYYGASLGRFVSVDPSRRSIRLMFPQTWNRYPYALNSPLVTFDPDGLSWRDAVKRAIRNPRVRAIGTYGASLLADYASQKLPPGKMRGAALGVAGTLTGISAYSSAQVSVAGYAVMLTPEFTGVTKVGGAVVGTVWLVFFIVEVDATGEYVYRAYVNIVEGVDPADHTTDQQTGSADDSSSDDADADSGDGEGEEGEDEEEGNDDQEDDELSPSEITLDRLQFGR